MWLGWCDGWFVSLTLCLRRRRERSSPAVYQTIRWLFEHAGGVPSGTRSMCRTPQTEYDCIAPLLDRFSMPDCFTAGTGDGAENDGVGTAVSLRTSRKPCRLMQTPIGSRGSRARKMAQWGVVSYVMSPRCCMHIYLSWTCAGAGNGIVFRRA
ncbi:unnamed protein product [Ectocarpus sp. 8 AP-2014]